MTDPHGTVAGSLVLDPENPWPGLDFFDEHARDYFHGREDEAIALLRRVTDAHVSVLFGKSGLGKTSLLKAGLFPRLRQQHYLPIYVRFAIRQDAPPFITQVCQAIRAVVESESVDIPLWPPDQSLWEFLHRRDLELWSSQNFPLTPIVVFDQFEELFTLGEGVPQAVGRFKIELADLAENRIPEALAARMASDAAFAATIDVRAMPCKFIVSLREDFLPDLEEWRRALPSLGRTRLRLLPMRPDQAMSAVYDTAPHLMDESIAHRIVEFVAAAQMAQSARGHEPQDTAATPAEHPEIEPALLSLFCRGLNDRRKRAGQPRFDNDLLEGAKQGIISDYYRSCVEGLPDSCSRFIETELITEKGFRNSYSRDDAVPAHLAAEQLDYLIKRRLLRIEERYGTERIELTHDLLTRAVLEHRTQRRQRDQEEERTRQTEAERERLERETRRQNARFRVAAAVAAACLFLAGAAGYQWYLATKERGRANDALKDSQARDLANQSLLAGPTDPTRALELALSAVDVKETSQSTVALRLAFAGMRLRGVVSPPPEKSYVGGDVSPAGDRMALVRRDRALDIRAIPSLALLHSRPATAGSDSPVPSAYFSADGTELFVVVSGKGVSRWNPGTGLELPVFASPDLSDRWLGESRNRLLLLIGDQFRSLDLSTGVATLLPRCPGTGKLLTATLSKSGAVAAFRDGLCIGRTRKALQIPERESPDWFSFSPDGAYLATSDAGSEIVRIWDVGTAKQVAAMQGFTAVPSSMSFIRPGAVVIGVDDGMVELWHFPETTGFERPDRIEQLTGSRERVVASFGASNAQWIITLHDQGALRVWEGISNRPGSREGLSDADVPPVYSRGAITVVQNGRLLRMTGNGQPQALAPSASRPSDEPPLVVTPSHHRGHALIAWANGLTQVWSLDDAAMVAEFTEERPLSNALWVTAGCRDSTASATGAPSCSVATVDVDHVLRIHPIGASDPSVQRLTLPSGARIDGAISADLRHWIEKTDGGLRLTDLQTGQARLVKLSGELIDGWQFSRDGRSVMSREGYAFLYLQSLASADAGKTLQGHAQRISSAVMSPEGARVLTASEDWTARLWDASNGSLLSTLRGHVSGVQNAMFSRDGSLVATTGRDNTLRVWEPASGTQILRFELDEKDSNGTLDDFNGASIVYRSKTDVLVIDCEPCRPLADLQRIGRDRVNVRVQ